jgi:hypothetical protein
MPPEDNPNNNNESDSGEQEGKVPSSKGEQERIKGDVLRRETQRISTLCLNMLIQQIFLRDSRMYQDQDNSSKYLLHKVHLFQILLKNL